VTVARDLRSVKKSPPVAVGQFSVLRRSVKSASLGSWGVLFLATLGDSGGILCARNGLIVEQVNPMESRDPKQTCQAVSRMDEPCDAAASVHCDICGCWFCAAHAEDETWHPCALEPGDEGGEA